MFLAAILLALSLLFFTAACATQTVQEQEEPAAEKPEEPEPEPEIEPEPEPEIVEEPEPEPDIEPEAEPEPVEEPEEEPAEPEEEEFVVTEEVFTQTFTDIEDLIRRLNSIIGASKYREWLDYLTEEYKDYYSDPEVLSEISERPILQKYNIKLTSLRDYFNYVVVPSRSNARLDDLVFEDNNQVKAIMIIEGQRVILYQLEKVEGEWKIGI